MFLMSLGYHCGTASMNIRPLNDGAASKCMHATVYISTLECPIGTKLSHGYAWLGLAIGRTREVRVDFACARWPPQLKSRTRPRLASPEAELMFSSCATTLTRTCPLSASATPNSGSSPTSSAAATPPQRRSRTYRPWQPPALAAASLGRSAPAAILAPPRKAQQHPARPR